MPQSEIIIESTFFKVLPTICKKFLPCPPYLLDLLSSATFSSALLGCFSQLQSYEVLLIHWYEPNCRVKTIQQQLMVAEKLSCSEFSAFFLIYTLQCGEEAGKFKTREFFNYPESFLYCLYSSKCDSKALFFLFRFRKLLLFGWSWSQS